MEGVKKQVGFAGTLKQFFDHIRTDPKFKPASREALQQGYVAIGKRLDATLPKLFATLPKTALEIRPVPALTEKGAARGSYNSGTPDGSRPGIFYFNAYDLPSRTTPGMETLYLHEGAPGHHFQISLAQENEALPKFQRFGGNTAYVEGWGLYAETLGRELGVYTDPYQYFGYLDSQLFRAIRLVVDTGIHSKGWTRDQTIQYILDNSSRGRTQRHRRDRALHRQSGAGAGLQDRPAQDQRNARPRRAAAGRALRRARFPRAGADERRHSARGVRTQDRRLDRGAKGRPAGQLVVTRPLSGRSLEVRGRTRDRAGRSRTAWPCRACRGAGPSSDIRR